MTGATVAIDRDWYHRQHEMHDWCVENFEQNSWDMSMMFGHQLYRFNDSSDAALFALRWGGKCYEDE